MATNYPDRAAAAGVEQCQRELQRHAQRRAAGVPTISLLAGPLTAAQSLWNTWAESDERQALYLERPTWQRWVASWLDRQNGAIREAAMEAVADRLPPAALPEDRKRRLGDGDAHELQLLLDEAGVGAAAGTTDWLYRLLLTGGPDPQQLLARLQESSIQQPDLWRTTLLLLSGLLPDERLPAILLMPFAEEASEQCQLSPLARMAARVTNSRPQYPLAIACPTALVEAFFRSPPDHRAKALLRESVIHLQPRRAVVADASELVQPVGEAHSRLKPKADTTHAGRLWQEARVALNAAVDGRRARAADDPQQRQREDAARSAAERYLFERLEQNETTRGLFELNGRMGFSFGASRRAEVDCVCRELHVAVEIDGYYHFQDADAYRRDRRKDALLQRHGFYVLRWLADDVVLRSDEVLEAICQIVHWRRKGE